MYSDDWFGGLNLCSVSEPERGVDLGVSESSLEVDTMAACCWILHVC